jgi:glycosyltransferase involved in cell wall biosynthesis
MVSTAIVIPCYNEAARFDIRAFEVFLAGNKDIDLIFVEDGSTDNTLEWINSLMLDHIGVVCVRLEINKGKAEAVRQGVLKAFEQRYDIIGYWDADLSTPLEMIDRMRKKLDGDVSLVIGARIKLLGYDVQQLALRHYLGRVYATIASSIVLNLPIYDTQCGAKIFRNSDEIRKAFLRPWHVNWSFDVELLGRLDIIKKAHNLPPLSKTAMEYPLETWIHREGSKVKPVDFFKGIMELLRLYILLNSSKYQNDILGL